MVWDLAIFPSEADFVLFKMQPLTFTNSLSQEINSSQNSDFTRHEVRQTLSHTATQQQQQQPLSLAAATAAAQIKERRLVLVLCRSLSDLPFFSVCRGFSFFFYLLISSPIHSFLLHFHIHVSPVLSPASPVVL